MKRQLASLAIALLIIMGVGGVEAQDEQYPESYDQQPGPQGQPGPEGSSSNQPPEAQPSDQAQPGAARVSFIHGDVSSQRGDNGEWVALTLNTPVMPGDRIATGHDSRTEVQLDYANVLRMSNDATANLTTLNRTNIQVQIGQGLVTYSVLKGAEATSEIDTPNAAIRPLGEGDYRILVNSNAETQVMVRSGAVEVATPQGSTRVERGQMITIAGSDDPQYKTDRAPGRDDWDSWNDDRDHLITADSLRQTDPYYVGSQDLDTNGTWSEIPDYGRVWQPRVDAGWAPYRDGRWVWEPYYGWTWVSYEPWGWAPYHYGRWFVYGGNWCWWPGPIIGYSDYYPLWAPAYVSFFGFGGDGFGVGVGFGRVGWLPIGPGDWYHPWYGRWGSRYTNVNFNNFNRVHEGFAPLGRGGRSFSNINESFRNERIRSGVSSMVGNEFGRGAVSGHQARISEASFRQASVMSGRMPITPGRGSFSATNRAASASTIRNASPSSQRFFTSSRAGAGSFASGGARAESSFGRNGSSIERPSTQGNTSEQSGRAGWRTFTPQSGSANRSDQGTESINRGVANNTARGSANTPSRQSDPSGNQGGWQHFTPRSSASRGETNGGNSNSSSRPTLNMRQNIVTPRSENSGRGSGSSTYGRSQYDGSYGSSAPRGSYGAPQSSEPRGGNYGAQPRSYSAPQGSYSPRGSYEAPRSSSEPRGGGYSAPRGGGGYSAPRGNYSAPRGGSSGGGGSRGGGSRGGGGGGHSGGRR